MYIVRFMESRFYYLMASLTSYGKTSFIYYSHDLRMSVCTEASYVYMNNKYMRSKSLED